MRVKRRARLLGGLLAAALMFRSALATDWSSCAGDPDEAVCVETYQQSDWAFGSEQALNGVNRGGVDHDSERAPTSVDELEALRVNVVALRRFMVIGFGALLGWQMMAYLFDAISRRR